MLRVRSPFKLFKPFPCSLPLTIYVAVDKHHLGTHLIRIVGAYEFDYRSGRDHLIDLVSSTVGPQLSILSSVAEHHIDFEATWDSESRQSKAIRLGARINLDSHLSVC
jgi:hypothetical protein